MPDFYRLLPQYWQQLYPSDKAWDDELNAALDKYGIKKINEYTCQVGPHTIWISNWPYAFGYNYNTLHIRLPLVKTRLRIKNLLEY